MIEANLHTLFWQDCARTMKRSWPVVCFITLLCLCLQATRANAINWVGILNGQPIRISTDLLESGEYVRATELFPLFPKRWNYDSLTETLYFIRNDGVRVGLKLNDQRVVAGTRIVQTGKPPIRQNNQVYIPFYVVNTFLFPQVRFSEADNDDSTSGVMQQTVYEPMATPTPLRFTYTTEATGTAFPTPTPNPLFPDLATPTMAMGIIEPAVGIAPNARIVIDPAHGGDNDPGAQSQMGVQESNLTLAFANKLAIYLRQTRNYEVFLTRQDSSRGLLGNEQRIAAANAFGGDLFVSLHCGGLYERDISWGGTYFMNSVLDTALSPVEAMALVSHSPSWHDAYRRYVPNSYHLAQSIHTRLKGFFEKSNIVQMNANPRPARLAILRGLAMPGIVVELGNLMNPNTASFLSKDRVQEEIAREIEMGITDFLYERVGSAVRQP